MGKSSPSPPPAPDYAGAARATAAGDAQAAVASNLMAHPNIYTPLGSQTWQAEGNASVPSISGQPGFDVPTYSQHVNLSPEGQDLYDKQLALSSGLLGLGNTSLDQTTASLGTPQNLQSVQDIADQSYQMQTDRLDPQWQQNQAMQENKLANQGLVPGGEAYDNAMRTFNEGKNDAYNQARLSSISTMPQTYQLDTAARMQPLTELNAIRSGAQPQMPQFQPVQYAGISGGPNMLGAAQAQGAYNQQNYQNQLGSSNAFMSGLFDLGSAGLQAYAMSDRRLKTNIEKLFTDKRGFSIYRFRYIWSPEWIIGVMADEIRKIIPEAVKTINGYDAVNYGLL